MDVVTRDQLKSMHNIRLDFTLEARPARRERLNAADWKQLPAFHLVMCFNGGSYYLHNSSRDRAVRVFDTLNALVEFATRHAPHAEQIVVKFE